MFFGNSKIRPLDFTPIFFKYGVTASVIAPSPLVMSVTTSGVVSGSSPRFTHSTEAKKLFKSIQIIFLSSIYNTNFCSL